METDRRFVLWQPSITLGKSDQLVASQLLDGDFVDGEMTGFPANS